jgi:ADP-ribose pyrophosphatase YjhB (NUDIX family)
MKKGEDFVGVSIVYLCHDGEGNILMAKRGKNCRDEKGVWDIGGGALEFGDTVESTLKKEIKEEYCTDVINYEFLGFQDVHRENEGKKTHWVALKFKVLVDKEKAKNGEPNKFDEIAWFSLDKLPKPQHSQLAKFLEEHKDKVFK